MYSLSFSLTHKEGYSIQSKVLLNNIKNNVDGLTSADIWFLTSEEASDTPAMSIGSSGGTIIEGIGGTAYYTVTTANIENGKNLQVSFNDSPIGLNITSSPIVNNNSATITVTGTAAVVSGIYTFSIKHTGASERTGTGFVGQNVPVITLNGDATMTISRGSIFEDPGYSAFDSKDGDLTSWVYIGGDEIREDFPGTYRRTYNVTNYNGIPSIEVVRDVIVPEFDPPEIVSVPSGSKRNLTITFDSPVTSATATFNQSKAATASLSNNNRTVTFSFSPDVDNKSNVTVRINTVSGITNYIFYLHGNSYTYDKK